MWLLLLLRLKFPLVKDVENCSSYAYLLQISHILQIFFLAKLYKHIACYRAQESMLRFRLVFAKPHGTRAEAGAEAGAAAAAQAQRRP